MVSGEAGPGGFCMSLVERESTPARVAASQVNGKKSKGPTTPEGKARASLNSLKTGAYAKTDKALREIMLRRGENPEDFEQLHQEFTEEWEPGYVTEATLVKTIAEKTFDKAQLRAGWMESQLSQWPVGSSGARATPSQVPETSTGANKSEGNTERGKGKREQVASAACSPEGAPASEPASASASPGQSGQSSQSTIATERGAADGVPPAKPVRSTAAGPSSVSSGVSSGGDSITQEAEGAA